MQTRTRQILEEESSVSLAASPSQSVSGQGILTGRSVKTMEDQLRAIIDTIPTLAWSAHSDGSAEFFNRRWLDMLESLLRRRVTGGGRPRFMRTIGTDSPTTGNRFWRPASQERSKRAYAVSTENIDGSCSVLSRYETILAISSDGMALIPISRIVSAPRHCWLQKNGPWK